MRPARDRAGQYATALNHLANVAILVISIGDGVSRCHPGDVGWIRLLKKIFVVRFDCPSFKVAKPHWIIFIAAAECRQMS
jgi:hypothetical protein